MKHAIPPAVLEQHLGILGKTGRGKTNTAKDCVEQVYDGDFRVCILDTIKSDWWGLTSSADGQRAGLPFHILGGPHAHLPLSSNTGRAIADLVARGQLRHTIIDMADFEPGGQMRWFVDFAPRLMQRMKGVLYLVIEEAHLLAPKERSGMGHENMSVHWAKMLAVAGRKKGIRLIVLSQRTQALHNAVIGSCDSMIVHGMTAPADMKPVIDWLKANSKDKERNATIEGSLSSLRKGEGWVCNAETGLFERVQFPKARTYDNTATPENDEELDEVKTAPVDVEKLRAILGKAAEEAEASDPKALRKRITELEAQIKGQATCPPVGSAEIDGYIKQGFDNGFAAAKNQAQQVVASVAQEIRSKAQHIIQALEFKEVITSTRSPPIELPIRAKGNELLTPAGVTEYLQGRQRKPPHQAPVNFDMELRARDAKPARALPWTVTKDDSEGVTVRENPKGLRARVLAGLRWLEERDIKPAPRAALGGIADFKPDTGHGARTLGELKTEGLVRYPVPGTVELTDEGRALAPAPPAYASMYEAWQAALKGLHREVLMTLYANHKHPVTREELGQVMGKQFERGYGARVLGELKSMGVVRYPTPGSLELTQHVIPN